MLPVWAEPVEASHDCFCSSLTRDTRPAGHSPNAQPSVTLDQVSLAATTVQGHGSDIGHWQKMKPGRHFENLVIIAAERC